MSRGPQRRLSYNSATCFHRAVKFCPSTTRQSQAISVLSKGLWARKPSASGPAACPCMADRQSGRAGTSCSRYSCDSSNLRTHRTSRLSLQSCSEKHSVKPRSKAPRNSALRHGKNGHRADQQVEIAIAVALPLPLPLPLPDSIKRAANLEAAAPASVGVSASLTPDAEFGAAHSGFGLCPQWFGRGRPLSRFSAAFSPRFGGWGRRPASIPFASFPRATKYPGSPR
jgi:hypothetical protein